MTCQTANLLKYSVSYRSLEKITCKGKGDGF